MWAQSLGQEDPLEEGMATHSSILAWRIPWVEEPGGLQSRTELYRVVQSRIRLNWLSTQTWSGLVCCSYAHLFPTLWDSMDCSLPGFSIHGILQARTLEWVAISFSN